MLTRGGARSAAWAGAVDVRACIRLGLVGAALALGLLLLAVIASPAPPPNSPLGGYTTPYTPSRDGFDVMLNHADGQAYATLAQDPTLSRPQAFVEGAPQAANFGARPLLPYLLFVGSLGRPGWIPPAFVAIEALAGGLLVVGAAAVLQSMGRRDQDRLALAVLLLPGAQLGLVLLGQDVLALGFALVGLVLLAGRRYAPLLAALAFTAAGLTRETALIALGLAVLHEWWGRGPRRRDVWLVVPFVAYAGWNEFSAHRLGARSGAGVASNLAWPFTGLVRAAGHWDPVGGLAVALLLVLVVVSLVRRTDSLLTWLTVGFLAATTISAEAVWHSWQSGVRVSLPVTVFALLNLRLPATIQHALTRKRVPMGAGPSPRAG